jgi:hypothetical protein
VEIATVAFGDLATFGIATPLAVARNDRGCIWLAMTPHLVIARSVATKQSRQGHRDLSSARNNEGIGIAKTNLRPKLEQN